MPKAWPSPFHRVTLPPLHDAGLPGGDAASPALWALGPDGKIDYDLLENFASRSVHDLAVVGKALTESFYGRPADHAFWNGCSTGGRQGLAAAQKYPEDFDGILAGAPAHYWTEFVIATLWPQVAMREVGYYPPPASSTQSIMLLLKLAIRMTASKMGS